MLNRYLVRLRSRRSGPGYRFERAITFDPTVGSHSNFYRSFRKLFFRRRSRRSRPDFRFERAITFDPTVGSHSNFYRSFRKLFFLE
jgi:hypothetical protein